MRFALISCIYANLAALEAVLRDTRTLGCDSVLCLGDIVGRNSNPGECVDLVRSCCVGSVKGDFDELCAGTASLEGVGLNARAREMFEWTRRELSAEQRAWLGELPYVLEVEDFMIVHAGLPAPEQWHFVFDNVAAAEHLSHQTRALCFSGHTLVSSAFYSRLGKVKGGTFSRTAIMSDAQYLVTVGGVGKCIPGHPGAHYVIYDSSERWVESRCIDYLGPDSGCEGAGRPVRVGGPDRSLRSPQ